MNKKEILEVKKILKNVGECPIGKGALSYKVGGLIRAIEIIVDSLAEENQPTPAPPPESAAIGG